MAAVAAVLLVLVAPAAAGGDAAPNTHLGRLWSAFPLDHSGHRGAPGRATEGPVSRSGAGPTSGAAATGPDVGLYAAIAGAALSTLALALLVFRLTPVRTTPRQLEGGSMSNMGRKLWTRRVNEYLGSDLEEHDVEETSETARREQEQPVPEQVASAAAGQPSDERSVVPADLADVGEEVGSVLRTAREAALRIRRNAEEEAARLREEAAASLAAESAEARRAAAKERAEVARIRKEAEAYAEDVRSGADAVAAHQRSEADREAAQILEGARQRLEAADEEAAKKVRQIEAKARQRVEALKADTRRYEERLESLYVVFRGMTSQLEELIGRPRENQDVEETLHDALRPDGGGAGAGETAVASGVRRDEPADGDGQD